MLSLWLIGWGLAAAFMWALWRLERRRRDATHVDAGWAFSIGALCLLYAWAGDGWLGRRILLAGMTCLWSWRLSAYILERSQGEHEDGRYARLRARWGEDAGRNFFWFFQAQGLLAALFSVPMLVCAFDGRAGWSWREPAAGAVLFISLLGETVADLQLAQWRGAPANKGKTCRAGLWRYSRHPNYFFEWLHWWVYPILGAGAQGWWATLGGPLLMLLFLYRVTGIPHTERQARRSRPDYAEYQRTTSPFIPWFPKEAA